MSAPLYALGSALRSGRPNVQRLLPTDGQTLLTPCGETECRRRLFYVQIPNNVSLPRLDISFALHIFRFEFYMFLTYFF